jgi:hypothetical protein
MIRLKALKISLIIMLLTLKIFHDEDDFMIIIIEHIKIGILLEAVRSFISNLQVIS